jgi:hypothetical protein
MFVLGLAVSAIFAPEWRVLHVLQSLIYVAVIALARRRSAWGFGAGLLIIVGCAIGFSRPRPRAPEWRHFAGGGIACVGYLLAIVFAFGPPQAVQLMRRAFGL